MKYTLQDKTGKETASVSFENGNVISLGGNAKVKDEAVSQEGYKPNVQSVKDMNSAQNALYEVFKAAIANKTVDDIKHGTVNVFPRKSLKNNKLVLGTFKIRMNLFNKNNISFKTVSKWFSEFKKSQEKKMRKFLKSYYKENQITFNGLFFELNNPNDKLSEGGYIYTNLDSIKFSGDAVKASESMNVIDAIFESIGFKGVENMKYTVSTKNVSEESNRPFTWINTIHVYNDGETSQEGHPKPNKKGYFAGDKLYNSYDALFNSPEFKEALDYAKEDCEATGYTPVSEREARAYAVNKRCAYRVVQGTPVLYKRIDADTGTMIATTLLIGVPISGNKQTDIVTAFIIARNPKGKEKKVMIAKKIEVKKSKTLDVTHHNAVQPKRK